MIYGKGSKGNYPVLSKFAKKLPVFPDIDNVRSMLYIENLCEFIRLMIINNECGIFMPQNSEYTRTSDMVKMIAEQGGHKIYMTRVFDPFLRMGEPFVGVVNKVWGKLHWLMDF